MSKRILVVEEEDAIAAFVATALEREGYSAAQVHTEREALSHIQGGRIYHVGEQQTSEVYTVSCLTRRAGWSGS